METKNWKWFYLKELFDIDTGKDLIYSELTVGSFPVIGHKAENNGITAMTCKLPTHKLYDYTQTISLADRGNFFATVQTHDFYVGTRVKALVSKFSVPIECLLFICVLINNEQYRFSYGRNCCDRIDAFQIKLPVDNNGNPNWQWIENYVMKTLVPKLPDKSKSVWEKEFDTKPLTNNKLQLNTKEWKWFKYIDVFEIKKGKRLTKADMVVGKIPYIGAIDSNNGVSSYISNNEQLHSANTITVSYNGSIAEAYYQAKEFWATDDVNVLYPKFLMNAYSALFLTTIINKEKYRFNYGRKWDKELMESSKIKLPIDEQGNPDWQWMEDYIKGLPYSGCL
ncbi:MAG: restriction endonuclease subunit S [Bacteroidales bacterium]|nr:restriction endonuclease subunit S [Bacteroidales bacterium]